MPETGRSLDYKDLQMDIERPSDPMPVSDPSEVTADGTIVGTPSYRRPAPSRASWDAMLRPRWTNLRSGESEAHA